MSEYPRYYKAVRRLANDKLVSLQCKKLHGDWVVEYLEDEWVEGPNGSKLYIANQIVPYEASEVWAVEVEDVTPIAMCVRTMLMSYPTVLDGFWLCHAEVPPNVHASGLRWLRNENYMRIVPCYAARRVKLLRQEWVSDTSWSAWQALRGEP